MDRCKLILLLLLVMASPAWAVVRTATMEWDYAPVGFADGVPCIIRAYVGPAFAGAAYDDLVEGVASTMTISYDLPVGRYSAVATAEVGKGPMWIANTTYTAGTIVVPRAYSMLLGDVYYTADPGGTSGATEPTWINTDGATIVDGTVTWTVHNDTPQPWAANTQYAAGREITPPVSAGLPGMIVFRCLVAGQSGATEPDWKSVFPNKRPGMQWERSWEIPTNTTIYDGTAQWTAAWRGECCSVSRQSNRIVLQGGTKFIEVGRRWN